jgi:signal transduction histidine kinase
MGVILTDTRKEVIQPAIREVDIRALNSPDYVQITVGKLPHSMSGDHHEDGCELVRQCVGKLEGRNFPAKLFVLWATNEFALSTDESSPYSDLLAGVNSQLAASGLGDVPLVGTSAAAVWFDQHVHENGITLVCIASPWIKVTVSAATDVRANPRAAAGRFFQGMKVECPTKRNPNINANGNRYLMMYAPGHSDDLHPSKYCAPEIVQEINRLTYSRLPIFGGVSAKGLKQGDGYQFCGQRVLQNSLVGALVTSDVAFGTGSNHGFESINRQVTITKVCPQSGRVLEVDDGQLRPATEWLEELHQEHVRVICTRHDKRSRFHTYVPQLEGDRVRFHHMVPEGQTLQVMAPSPLRLEFSVRELERWLIDQFETDGSKVRAILSIGCVSRYRMKDEIHFDLEGALKKAQDRYPDAEHIGCYLDGEFGKENQQKASTATNMSVAELLINDWVPARYRNRRINEAIAEFGPKASVARTVNEAIDSVLKCLKHTGFPGAMISLTYRDGDRFWFKANGATGKHWPDIVMPNTNRSAGDNDILAIAAKSPNEVHIVPDAQTDPRSKNELARDAGVKTIAAMALLDARSEVLGVLVVDLGDHEVTPVRDDVKVGLRMLAVSISRWLSGATQSEELQVAREVDELARKALTQPTVVRATQEFVLGALELMGLDGHARLWSSEVQNLCLEAGRGKYFEEAPKYRRRIRLDDNSSTAEAFRLGQDRVINNSDEDELAQPIRQRFGETHPLGKLLRSHRSFGNFVIPRHPMTAAEGGDSHPNGVITVVHQQPWFFTTAYVRSMERVSQRLGEIIDHVRAIESKNVEMVKLKYRNETSPPTWDDRPPLEALQSYIENLCRANNAEVASCYLRSDAQDRFVLRAQSGWSNPNWVHAAWFQSGEGMSGRLLERDEPTYISDRFDMHLEGIPCKYIHAMFEDDTLNDPSRTYELLVFPLRFQRKKLGVVTMYRRRQRPDGFELGPSQFTTTDKAPLRDASQAMSAYVAALMQADRDRWEHLEDDRLAEIEERVEEFLEMHQELNITEFSNQLCDGIRDAYRTVACVLYLQDENSEGRLKVSGQSWRKNGSPSWSSSFVDDVARNRQAVIQRFGESGQPRCPEAVRVENQVQRAFFPLSGDGPECLGVLALQWTGAIYPRPKEGLPYHDQRKLQEVADVVADAVQRFRSKKRAIQANASLLGMAGYLAIAMHEMRNKVQSIQSAIRIISDKTDVTEEDRDTALAHGQRSVTELREVFDLAQTRASLLIQPPQKQWVTPAELVARAIEQCRTGRGIRCGLTYNPPPLSEQLDFCVDVGQMVECLRNLISNAIRESKDLGTVVIRMSSDPAKATCMIDIEDSGVGISRKAFDDFTHGRFGSLTPQGSGLGLFMSQLFCDANGCRLKLQSERQPTVFTVVFSGGRSC